VELALPWQVRDYATILDCLPQKRTRFGILNINREYCLRNGIVPHGFGSDQEADGGGGGTQQASASHRLLLEKNRWWEMALKPLRKLVGDLEDRRGSKGEFHLPEACSVRKKQNKRRAEGKWSMTPLLPVLFFAWVVVCDLLFWFL